MGAGLVQAVRLCIGRQHVISFPDRERDHALHDDVFQCITCYTLSSEDLSMYTIISITYNITPL